MIKELEISNLAVIEDAKLTFDSSYVSLVGETGAGKSLIVASFTLLEGERADFSLLRDKSKKAIVYALFQVEKEYVTKNPQIRDFVDENGFVSLKRVLNPDKSSRCFINDEAVSTGTLKQISSHLIDIHSQNQRNDILNEEMQLEYLDIFGGEEIQKAKIKFQKAYEKYQMTFAEYQKLIPNSKENDRDYLAFQIAEIEKYHLEEEEIERLNEEFESLKEISKLQDNYQHVIEAMHASNISIKDQLSLLSNRLKSLEGTSLDLEAKESNDGIRSLLLSLDNLTESYENLVLNPERIDEFNERLFSLKGLQRKYGKSTADILSKLEEYKVKLSFIDTYEERKANLEEEVKVLKENAMTFAYQLHLAREKYALKLGQLISLEASDLGLRKQALTVVLEEVELYEKGIDHCAFIVEFNAGIDKASLAKAASGGEASRLMLALKVVLNRLHPYDLMILDEIDTGISGKQALLVAEKIKSISKDNQVLVISHLPQVVASAKSAIEIKKVIDEVKHMTYSTARSLSEEEIISVVAKMLSGTKLTDAARKQALLLRKETRDNDQ